MGEDSLETLLVGLDGASRRVVDPLVEDGHVPRLASVLNAGAYGTLESQIPPWTASAWPSLYTGVNPGKHGVFGHVRYDGYDWNVVSGSDLEELTVWELLTHNDKTSVVVNTPVTHSPREFDGALVPGYTAPEYSEWYPTEAAKAFEGEFGPYRIYPDDRADPHEEYPELVRMRGDAFRHLADRFDPDFGFVLFRMTERVLQEHPTDETLLETVYRAVDEQLDRLLTRYDPNTVVVVSDHGMARSDRELRVNEFLRREGYLQPTRNADPVPPPDPGAASRPERRGVGEATGTRTTGEPRSPLRGATARVAELFRRFGLGTDRDGSDPEQARFTADFAESTAYMRSRVEPGIRINRRSGDSEGIVRADDYERVREELIGSLSDLTTPDGEPAYADVARREKYFWGPYAGDTSDIVLVPNDHRWTLSTELGGEPVGRGTDQWVPTFEGIVAIAGDTVDPETDLSEAHLFDVAPTVLASLSVPVSDRMHGDVIPAVPATERRSYPFLESYPIGIESGTDPD